MSDELRWVQIQGEQADGILCEQGAHVTDWTPSDEGPVLFLSGQSHLAPGLPIRGGIPVIFPWFGDAPLPLGGEGLPAHGFARRKDWEVLSIDEGPGDVRVSLRLVDDEDTRAAWPHKFELRLEATFGRTLEVSLTIENRDERPFRCDAALHTYLTVGDVREIAVRGLEGAPYFDKVAGEEKVQDAAPIRFEGEVDRVYTNNEAGVTVDDPSFGRSITVSKTGSRSTIVWNPWIDKARRLDDFDNDEWMGMVCVETANVLTDAIELGPGASHTMTLCLSVGPETGAQ
jgi:glucose-6-phosphate 1-epimerase